jgi:hypothetical protein
MCAITLRDMVHAVSLVFSFFLLAQLEYYGEGEILFFFKRFISPPL